MDIEQALKAAMEAVKKADIPPELQEVAFSKAFDALNVVANPPTPATTNNSVDPVSGTGAPTGNLQKVAEFFGLDAERFDDIFTEHDGNPQVVLDTARLGTNNSERAKAVALLVVVARQIGGYDSGTTAIQIVRDECERCGVYDSKNFSMQMTALKATMIINGQKTERTFKIKPATRASAKDLVASLVAE